MKNVSSFVHSLGLKFGLYSDRGSKTCGGFPGSLGYEFVDASAYADWGVDSLKEDNCNAPGGASNREIQLSEFEKMRDALNATGRPILFSVCGGGSEYPWSDLSYFAKPPFGKAIANLWRVGPDTIEWFSMRHNLALDSALSTYAGPGGWNDPDLLLTSAEEAHFKLTEKESRAQFAMWCILASPLLISGPVGELSDYDMGTYANKELIAVNQDPLAKQGITLYYTQPLGSKVILGRELFDTSLATVFLNADVLLSAEVTCDPACWNKTHFKPGTKLAVRDLYRHSPAEKAMAVVGEDYAVHLGPDGGSAALKFTPIPV